MAFFKKHTFTILLFFFESDKLPRIVYIDKQREFLKIWFFDESRFFKEPKFEMNYIFVICCIYWNFFILLGGWKITDTSQTSLGSSQSSQRISKVHGTIHQQSIKKTFFWSVYLIWSFLVWERSCSYWTTGCSSWRFVRFTTSSSWTSQ